MIYQEAVNRQAEQRFKEREKTRDAHRKQLKNLEEGKGFDWTKVEDAPRLAERARRLGFFDEAGALLRDPKDPEAGNRVFEQIIAANNLLGVTFLFEGARMARAVGRITLPVPGGTKLGTGFMVSSRVMMTNNHVLGDRIEAGSASLEFDFFQREDGTTGPTTRFRLQPDIFFVTDMPLDFTLVAVSETNDDGVSVGERGWFPLVGPSGKAVVGERLSIIQHPNGEPQKVSVHDNKLIDVDGDFLHYETDTMGGSSGSPVLNIDWDLAALHHAAVGNTNEGVRISVIVAKLRKLFESEVVGDVGDSTLLSELLASRPAPLPDLSPDSRGHTRIVTRDGPQIQPDGTASWIVPVSLTLGVGKPSGPVASQIIVPKRSVPVPAEPVEDFDLQTAIQALEDTEGRVYYSEVKDKEARDNYYPDLSDLNKTQFYETLSTLLSDTHTTVLSYKTARLRHLYPWIDRRMDAHRTLKGIYSGQVFDALEVIRREVQMERRRERAIHERLMLESMEGVDETFLEELETMAPFNCEHVVPQSWFNKKKTPKTDLHHLFTCEWKCNSFRGNRAYFDFETEAYREGCGQSDDGKFEPIRGKGAVARATLYFLLRYPGEVADNGNEMPKDRLKSIIDWAKSDKVDRWERHRNAEIHTVQGNRNPLIDFPDLVDKINFGLAWA